MKDGYEDFDQGYVTGIDTKSVHWPLTRLWAGQAFGCAHIAGLKWQSIRKLLHTSCAVKADSRVLFRPINQGKGGWFQFALYGLFHKLFQEPVASYGNSVSMLHSPTDKVEQRVLLIPASSAAYEHWLEETLFRIGPEANDLGKDTAVRGNRGVS